MQATTIGVDLAKNVFQVHGIAENDDVLFNKPLRRAQFLPFFAKLKRFQRLLNQRGFTGVMFSDSSCSGGSVHAQPAFCRYSHAF
jgi:hypothetical protein